MRRRCEELGCSRLAMSKGYSTTGKRCYGKLCGKHHKLKYGMRLSPRWRGGLKESQYKEMFERQGGVCAICGKPSRKNLAVDHCHATKAIRGLLCFGCNVLLGLAHDDVKVLEQAIAYLTRDK